MSPDSVSAFALSSDEGPGVGSSHERDLLYGSFQAAEKYAVPVRTWLCRLSGGSSQVEDLVQETFLSAYRARDSFKGGSSLKTWLFAIARNTYLSHARTAGRRPVEYMPEIPEWVQPYRQSVEDIVVERDDSRALARRFDKMGIQHQAVLMLRYLELSYKEIARFMGTNEHGAKSRLHRARQLLRPALETT